MVDKWVIQQSTHHGSSARDELLRSATSNYAVLETGIQRRLAVKRLEQLTRPHRRLIVIIYYFLDVPPAHRFGKSGKRRNWGKTQLIF
jgi:hypothetical protein